MNAAHAGLLVGARFEVELDLPEGMGFNVQGMCLDWVVDDPAAGRRGFARVCDKSKSY